MPNITFHPDIELEIMASYEWYQKQANGLGDDFLEELETAYQAIIEFPDAWPNFQQCFRRFVLNKFPFSVIYKFSQDTIFIVAVMHNSRKPNYWHERA